MPSNHKRHHPARAGAQVAADTAAPPETPKDSTPEQSARPADARPTEGGTAPPPSPPAPERRPGLNITDLKDMSIQKLTQIAKDLTVGGATGMRKQELIFQILKAQTEQSGFIFSEGVLEVL